MVHALKISPQYYNDVDKGIKKFEVRKNDRDYKVGDFIALNEWENEKYTENCTLVKIIYILNDIAYCKKGFVIIGIEMCYVETDADDIITEKYDYE